MLLADSFSWIDPSTWPWFFYVWLLFLAAGFLKPAWRWFVRQRVDHWPSVEGKIDSVSVTESKGLLGLNNSTRGQNGYLAQIAYSYSIDGSSYGGNYRKECATQEDAEEFVRDLKGKDLTVRYNANKHASSALSEASLEALQKTRAPAPAGTFIDPARTIPQWAIPFLWVFAVLSLAGLVLSLYVHINALMGGQMPPTTWGLHVGIFVVWFPAVFVAQRRVGNTRRKDFWKVALKGAPDWMRYLIYGLFVYAFLNFFVFIASAPAHNSSSGGEESPSVWRGFSGHWMVFYAAAFAILYSAAMAAKSGPRCMSGHSLSAGETSCRICGQPFSPVE